MRVSFHVDNMYAEREFYTSVYRGDVIPSDKHAKFNQKASVYIDYITLNRVKKLETIPDEVKFATCSVMDYMYQLTNGTGLLPLQNKTSESVGDYSVSYEQSNKEIETLYYRAAKEYLAHTGLMYRGG